MPGPITPAVIRVMAIFENVSGVSEDRVVNSFHFFCADDVNAGHLGDAGARIISLYNDANEGGNPLAYYLSSHLDRGTNKAQVRCYDLGTSEPREAHAQVFTLGAASSSSVNLPNEVCVTTSYYVQRNLPRLRGRFYLGPLNGSSMEDSGGDARVVPALRNDLARALQRIIALDDTLSLGVLSRADNAIKSPIEGGWTDNAFDTQRRRGRSAAVRTQWVA